MVPTVLGAVSGDLRVDAAVRRWRRWPSRVAAMKIAVIGPTHGQLASSPDLAQ